MANQRFVTASAPGRVCFAGEKLDWLVGPSVLAAIDLRTTVTVAAPAEDRNEILLKSSRPIFSQKSLTRDCLGEYNGHGTDYLQAALQIMARLGCQIQPIEIEASSDIPTSAGLSSSAAVSVAAIAALAEYFEVDVSILDICNLAYSIEDTELKTGAGQMDFYACGLGGIIYLDSSRVPPSPIERYVLPKDIRVVIVDSRTPKSTQSVTKLIRARVAELDPQIISYIDLTSNAVQRLRELLADFNVNLDLFGEVISDCHTYIRDYMRVSTRLIDLCVNECLENGALGAKLTGSGMGGCLFAISHTSSIDRIVAAMRRRPVNVYATDISALGVRVESRS